MRLQAKRGPDPADSGVRKSGLGGHGADRPVGRILGCRVQRALNYLSHLSIRYRPRATGAILVGEPFNTVLHEPPPPLADRVLVHPEALGDLLTLKAICT